MITARRIDEFEVCASHRKFQAGEAIVALLCTLPFGHDGDHYDNIYHMEWC